MLPPPRPRPHPVRHTSMGVQVDMGERTDGKGDRVTLSNLDVRGGADWDCSIAALATNGRIPLETSTKGADPVLGHNANEAEGTAATVKDEGAFITGDNQHTVGTKESEGAEAVISDKVRNTNEDLIIASSVAADTKGGILGWWRRPKGVLQNFGNRTIVIGKTTKALGKRTKVFDKTTGAFGKTTEVLSKQLKVGPTERRRSVESDNRTW